MQFLLPSAALAATAFSSVAYAGVAAVKNHCGSPMYLWSVGDVQSEIIEIPDRHTVYNETYRSKNGGGGVSIKISGTSTLSKNQTQFEYTTDPTSHKVWYDISNVDGNALTGVNYVLKASDPDCPVVNCAADDAKCKAVYNVWNDDAATHACDINADLIFTLCPDDDGSAATGTSSSSSSSSSSASSSTSPSSTPSQDPSTAGASDARNGAIVNADGTVGTGPSNKGATVGTSSTGGSSDRTGDSSDSTSDATKFVTFHLPKAKRAEHVHSHHAREHIHQRLRRSRVFRHE